MRKNTKSDSHKLFFDTERHDVIEF